MSTIHTANLFLLSYNQQPPNSASMNATFIEPPQPPTAMQPHTTDNAPRPMKIFVAFDEDDCARNAEVLIHRVAPDELCDTELCRLEQVAERVQGDAVARSAAEADLFIIAMRDGNTLTQSARTWLSRLLALRDTDHEGALAVLLSGTNPRNAELLAYLETLAVLNRLEFFAGRVEPREEASTPSVQVFSKTLVHATQGNLRGGNE